LKESYQAGQSMNSTARPDTILSMTLEKEKEQVRLSLEALVPEALEAYEEKLYAEKCSTYRTEKGN